MITIKHEDWINEAMERYPNSSKISFKCPVCGHSATLEEYKLAGAKDGQIGFVCIGRFLNAHKKAFGSSHENVPNGPCDYSGGGLFRLNPIRVLFKDGTHSDYFDFSDNPLSEDPKYRESPEEHHCPSGKTDTCPDNEEE